MASIRLRGITKNFGRVEVLRGIDLDMVDGEFVVLLGPSGCGNSTLLRLIAGLEVQTDGDILFDGRSIAGQAPEDRGCAMILPDLALCPRMTVADNLGFGQRGAGDGASEWHHRVEETAKTAELARLLDRKPGQPSAAERQRVRVARAIIGPPGVLLFDDPFASLNSDIRAQARHEIRRIHNRAGATSVFVTHDPVEAMALADRLVVMRSGRIEQVGSPEEVYETPASIHVAGLVGAPSMNFLHGQLDDSGIKVVLPGGAVIDLATRCAALPGATVTVGVRPESLRVGRGDGALTGVFDFSEDHGDSYLHHLDIDGRRVTMRSAERHGFARGELVRLRIAPGAVHLFDPATERRIGPARAASPG